MAYQFPLNGGRINASIVGTHTAGAPGIISTGTMFLSGGNNVTLSQNGNTIGISAGNAPAGSVNFSAGTTSGNLGSVVFSNSNGVGFGLNGSVITASHNALTSQSVQTQNAVSVLGSTGNISFANGNGVTFGGNNSTITASVPATSSLQGAGAISIGTNGNTVSVAAPVQSNLSATGAVSIATNGNTISIGAPAQTNQTLGIYGASNTTLSSSGTIDARSLSFQGAGGASVGYSNGSVIISGATGGGGGGGVAVSGAGTMFSSGTVNLSASGALVISSSTNGYNFGVPNTSSLAATGIASISTNGDTISIGAPAYSVGIASDNVSQITNKLLIAAGNNVTLSQSTGAGGGTISIGAPSQTNQTLGIYGVGNTVSSSSGTLDARSLSFRGVGGANVGYSNGSVVISGGGGGGGIALTGGGTSFSSGTVNLAASAPLFLSTNGNGYTFTAPATSSIAGAGAITVGTNGSTISVGAPVQSNLSATGGASISTNGNTIYIGAPSGGGTLSRWEYPSQVFTALTAPAYGSLSMQRIHVPSNISGTAMQIAASINTIAAVTASTASVNISLNMGIYTLTGSSLSRVSSGSANNGFTWSSGAAQSSAYVSLRQLTVPITISMTPGEYWVAAILNTAQTYSGATITSIWGDNQAPATGILGVLGGNASIGQDVLLGQGLFGTSALPSTVAVSAIVNSGAQARAAAFYHAIYNAAY